MWTLKRTRRSVRVAELQKGVCESQLTELFGGCEATGDQCLSGVDPTCESSAVRCYAWANAVVHCSLFARKKTLRQLHTCGGRERVGLRQVLSRGEEFCVWHVRTLLRDQLSATRGVPQAID